MTDQIWLASTKLFCMLAMFVMIQVTGNIPLKPHGFSSNPKLMSLSSAFSGGLFLAVGIIHLMPDAIHQFEPGKPYAQCLCLLSFLVFLYIEKIAFEDAYARGSVGSNEEPAASTLVPYILQLAIGIHAFFEGLAIGIETHVSDCMGIGNAHTV